MGIILAEVALGKCQEDKCGRLVESSEKIGKRLAKEFAKISDEYNNKKISKEEFNKKMVALKEKAMKNKANLALLKCSIEECNENIKQLLRANVDNLKMLCDIKKKRSGNSDVGISECGIYNEYKNMFTKKTKKPISYEEYIIFMDKLAAAL